VSSIYTSINTHLVQVLIKTVVLACDLTAFKAKGSFSVLSGGCLPDQSAVVCRSNADPSASLNLNSRSLFVLNILYAEYGKDLLSDLSRPFLTWKQSINACVKSNKLNKKMQDCMTTFKIVTDIRTSWPHKVSHEIVFKRLNEYVQGTVWMIEHSTPL
jgi:hypothetical protein